MSNYWQVSTRTQVVINCLILLHQNAPKDILSQVLGSQVSPGFLDDAMSYNSLTTLLCCQVKICSFFCKTGQSVRKYLRWDGSSREGRARAPGQTRRGRTKDQSRLYSERKGAEVSWTKKNNQLGLHLKKRNLRLALGAIYKLCNAIRRGGGG